MKVWNQVKKYSFYIFLALLNLGKALGYVSRDREFLLLMVLAAPFALIKFFSTKWTKKELIVGIALNLLGVVVTVFSRKTTYLMTIFAITLAKDVNLKLAMKICLWIRGGFFVLRTTLAMLGVIDIQMMLRDVVWTERFGLGYGHPNTTQFELLMILLLLCVVYFERLKLWHYVAMAAYSVFIFSYTDARTSILLCLIFVCGMWIASQKWAGFVRKLIAFCSNKIWIFMTLIAAAGTILYVYAPHVIGNGTFAMRFKNAVEQFSFNLLGAPNITTDLGHLHILYSGGIVITLLFLYSMTVLPGILGKNREIPIHWASICVATFSMMEFTAYSILSNALLLYVSFVLYPDMQKQLDEQTCDDHREKRVLYLTNVEVPYRVRFFNQLAQHCALTVLYERKRASNRNNVWSGSEQILFRTEYLEGKPIGDQNAFSLRILSKIFGFDVVIVGCYNSPVQILAILCMRLTGKKYYINADGETFLTGKGLKQCLKRMLLRGATGYLAAGEKSAQTLSAAVGKPVTPYYFTSLDEAELKVNRERTCQRGKEVLVVGQYVPEKGLATALEAAKIDSSIQYRFIGTGSRTEQFMKDYAVETIPNVQVIPFLQKQALEQEYCRCGLFVLPSDKECWGLVINEAASFGTPIVSTWGSGAAVDFLADEYAQYLVQPGDARALHACIVDLLNSDNTAYSNYLIEKSKNYSIEESVRAHIDACGLA